MIAHIRKSDWEIQGVQSHLDAVAKIAKVYGRKSGFTAASELAGLLHDMGKNTKAFSNYIECAVKETGEPLEKIDHSTAGAKYLYEKYYMEKPKSQEDFIQSLTVELIGMVILSHHSGLQNFVQVDGKQSDFFRRVCNAELPYFDEVRTEFLKIPTNQSRVEHLFHAAVEEMNAFSTKIAQLFKQYDVGKATPYLYVSLAMKYVFSCLIDADRTDTRRFEENDVRELFDSNEAFFKESYAHLMEQVEIWAQGEAATKPINQLRAEMSEQCDKLAEQPSSIYQLSIPTGGGKTYASLRYALKHAYLMEKERIIYVVPFTTILEQNADEVRKIIKNEAQVLEHHANVIDDSEQDNDTDSYQNLQQKDIQLARDNWDHPIIFTTMVQFLDTFYAKGTRKSRRLHNLTNAVIIFDEVQSVPVKHISLFNTAVNYLHHIGNSSVILCTATQPSLTKTDYPMMIPNHAEMIQNLPNVVKAFERVTIESKVDKDGWDAEKISEFTLEELENQQSALIILNTKKAVLNVYQQLQETPNVSVYHLSTSMCPAHRKVILDEVREKLDQKQEKVICISTQLIEAGVDISFQTVIRSLAGIDSIAQAAGRCNRHAEMEKGMVYIIHAKDEVLTKLPELQLGQEVTEEDILSRHQFANDLLSPDAIQTYFDYYLSKAKRTIKLTDKNLEVELIDLLNLSTKYFDGIPQGQSKNLMRTMYKTVESNFQVIEAPTTAILVPYGDGKEIISRLNEEIDSYEELNDYIKKAQQFSVNVYHHTLRHLANEDLIVPLYNESIYALKDGAYDDQYGLELEGDGSLQPLSF